MRKNTPLIDRVLPLARVIPAVIVALAPLPGLCTSTGDPLHPLGGTTLELIIGRVISVILGLLGSISLVMFVYGGITWMTAAGNDEKIKKAKNTIVYAVFGLIVAFSAFGILEVFMEQVLKPAVKTAT
ncbi:MAG TPA: pilin [Candidatus Eisenbacteria bacterium]|jgi:hypothetical protein|nr:pilin [Candidatus Eisenbacteria bacterium]